MSPLYDHDGWKLYVCPELAALDARLKVHHTRWKPGDRAEVEAVVAKHTPGHGQELVLHREGAMIPPVPICPGCRKLMILGDSSQE